MYRFLLFLVCPSDVVFFQAWPWVHRLRLWLWQQIGTILRFRWQVQLVHYSLQPWVPLHFEMSLMPVELERKQKESTTDAQTHRRTDQRGRHRKTCPNKSKTCFHKIHKPKKHVSKQTQKHNVFSQQSAFPIKKHEISYYAPCLVEASRGPETMPSSGSCTSRSQKKHETRTNPPKILMFRWFWRVFWCFVDFVCFFCVFLCFLWFLDFHRQLQMRVFLLVLEEVKWRGLAAWAYKSSLRFLDVHDFFLWHNNALWCTLLLCWVRWVL